MANTQKLKSLIADWESTSDDIPLGLDEDDRVILEAMKFAADNHDIAARLEAAEGQLAELAKQEPVAYTDAEELEIMRKGTFADMFTPDDSYKSDPQWIPLFTRAAPPAPFVVRLPNRLSPEGYHIDEAYMVEDVDGDYLDRDDVIEAIKAAGGSVEDDK